MASFNKLKDGKTRVFVARQGYLNVSLKKSIKRYGD